MREANDGVAVVVAGASEPRSSSASIRAWSATIYLRLGGLVGVGVEQNLRLGGLEGLADGAHRESVERG